MSNQLELRTGDARKRFDAHVDRLTKEDLGSKLEGTAFDRICALLVSFGDVYDVSHNEMLGLSRMIALCWAAKGKIKINGRDHQSGGRGFKPHAVVYGLKRAADLCQRFPTEGLLAEIIRGGDGANYPGGMLKGQDAPPEPLKSDGAIAGLALAERFDLDNERRGLRGDLETTGELARERIAEVRELMGPKWGAIPTAPPTNDAINERRNAFHKAAAEDQQTPPGDDCPV